MRILYICEGRHDNIRYWSGTEYHIAKMLKEMGNEVIYLDDIKGSFFVRAVCKLITKISGKQYKALRDPRNLKAAARKIKKMQCGMEYDVIFTTCTPLLAYLDLERPKVVYTDTSFAGWLEYCRLFSPLSKATVEYGEYHEKKALLKCSRILYSSQWGKDVACRAYGLDPGKVQIIPFGANLTCQMSEEDLERICESRQKQEEKRLLFVGFNWRNKGGQRALDAVKEMNQRGMKTKLVIVGCTPELSDEDRKYAEIHGFLDKNVEEDRKKLEELYIHANLFILPTRFDCTPIVLAESASFGLPAVITDTCGVSNMMIDGVTGNLMDYEADGIAYAEKAMEMLGDPERYKEYCYGARRGFCEKFNWNEVGKQVQKVLEEVV